MCLVTYADAIFTLILKADYIQPGLYQMQDGILFFVQEQNAVFHVHTSSCGRWENVFAPFNRFVKFTTHLQVSGKVSIASGAATVCRHGGRTFNVFACFRHIDRQLPKRSLK